MELSWPTEMVEKISKNVVLYDSEKMFLKQKKQLAQNSKKSIVLIKKWSFWAKK